MILKISPTKISSTKEPISTKNTDINKIVIFDKVSFGKKGFKYFIGYKDAKYQRLVILYVYFYQKWLHIEKSLTKLSIYLSW